MQCNSTLRAQQIVNAFDATHSKRVAQIQIDQKGADESSDYGSGYLLNVAKASADLHGL
jgi:hypothetical protein